MTAGQKVRVTGARAFTGIVLGVNDTVMSIAIDPQRTVHLRRDLASTTPEQWRYGKLPVTVQVIGQRADDFAERLADLERRTRE